MNGRFLLVAAAALAAAAGATAWTLRGREGPGAEGVPELRPVRVTPPVAALEGDLFEDVTERAGIRFVQSGGDGRMDHLVESVGAGAAWLDADGDGRLDLLLLDQAFTPPVSKGEPPPGRARHRLWRNRGDGTFEDATDRADLGEAGFAIAVAVADYDGDGDADVYIANFGRNRLLRNRGDGRFEDVTEHAGVGDGERTSVAAAFLDADGDGSLDLYVGNYVEVDPDYHLHYGPDAFPGPLAFAAQPDALYLNRGDGTFRPAPAGCGLDVAPGRAMGVTPLDYDLDGRTDLFVANDASANFLFHNLGGGRFEELGYATGVAFGVSGEATAAMAGTVGDFDGDGLPDLCVTDSSYGALYRNTGRGTFQDRAVAAGVAAASAQWASWGGGFLDYDLDGLDDLYLVNGDMHHPTARPDLLLRNRGDGRVEDVSPSAGAWFRAATAGRGGAIADYDDDGRPDVLVTNIADRPVLLRNRAGAGRHWAALLLRGAPPATRAHGHAYGAIVTLEAGGRRWVRSHQPASGYLTQGDPRMRFGLGDATRIDRVEVRWTDGTRTVLEGLEVDRVHTIRQAEGAR